MPDSSRDSERPTDRLSYERWLKDEHAVEVGDRLRTRHEAVVAKVHTDFLASEFWERIATGIADLDGEYRLGANNLPLFLTPTAPEVKVKSFDSFLLKTYRRNVLDNELWPGPPEGGWLVPDTWLSQVSDLVRTAFVVKYLDGVRFLADRLGTLCTELGLRHELSFEARAEGHYAAHLKVIDTFQVPDEKWDTKRVEMAIEIQIHTQLQEVIQRMLHAYYEARRVLPQRERAGWQWEYESDEFVANYLGHILHYVEGMIMEVRSRQEGNEGGNEWQA